MTRTPSQTTARPMSSPPGISAAQQRTACNRQGDDEGHEATSGRALNRREAGLSMSPTCVKAMMDHVPDDKPRTATKHQRVLDNGGHETKGGLSSPRPIAMLGDFREIPLVDMSQPDAKVAASVGWAARNVGFFYVVNHGVPDELCEETFSLAKRFFSLPGKKKVALLNTKSRRNLRGYFGLGQEDLNAKDGTRDLSAEGDALTEYQGDFKEGFDTGRDLPPDDPCRNMFSDNLWPGEEDLPGFREGLLRYQSALLALADKLLVAFALSLGIDPTYFVARSRKPMCTLRLLHYPPKKNNDAAKWKHAGEKRKLSNSSSRKGQLGCGAHTDYGLITILKQDSIGGLQVRNGAHAWIEARPIKGAFVINLGDMMSRWTNGMYSSTVHRVENESSTDRYSMPFFFNPDFDTTVEPLACCIGSGEVPRYTGENAADLLLNRYKGTFCHDS